MKKEILNKINNAIEEAEIIEHSSLEVDVVDSVRNVLWHLRNAVTDIETLNN